MDNINSAALSHIEKLSLIRGSQKNETTIIIIRGNFRMRKINICQWLILGIETKFSPILISLIIRVIYSIGSSELFTRWKFCWQNFRQRHVLATGENFHVYGIQSRCLWDLEHCLLNLQCPLAKKVVLANPPHSSEMRFAPCATNKIYLELTCGQGGNSCLCAWCHCGPTLCRTMDFTDTQI